MWYRQHQLDIIIQDFNLEKNHRKQEDMHWTLPSEDGGMWLADMELSECPLPALSAGFMPSAVALVFTSQL